MKVILQRTSKASVSVGGRIIGSIGKGYVLLVGIMEGDAEEQAKELSEKIAKLRLFDGENGKINDRSITDIRGEILVISQFTLAGKMEKGNRPDYTAAAHPDTAKPLYARFIELLRGHGIPVEHGEFGAYMQVELVNEGPVTLVLER